MGLIGRPINAQVSETPGVSVVHNFGFKDEKGREIGAYVVTREVVIAVVPAPDTWTCGFSLPVGTYFCAYVHATRDGSTFGALQRTEYSTSEAERQVYIERRLKDSRKAAAKKAAKAGAA